MVDDAATAPACSTAFDAQTLLTGLIPGMNMPAAAMARRTQARLGPRSGTGAVTERTTGGANKPDPAFSTPRDILQRNINRKTDIGTAHPLGAKSIAKKSQEQGKIEPGTAAPRP